MQILESYRLRKPQMVPLLFIIVATITLAGLGLWQMQRLTWKEDIIAKADAANALPALTQLPLIDENTLTLEYRHVALTGAFASQSPLMLNASLKGVYGMQYILPFVTNEGALIFVNIGFVPKQIGELALPLYNETTIKGVLHTTRQKRFFSPANQPEKNVWFYEDIPQMQKARGMDTEKVQFYPLIVAMTEPLPGYSGRYPKPHAEEIIFRNNHLGYAITWLLLALAGVIMFIIYHLEKKEA